MSIGRVPGNTGIQPSIVDAKGDLIVATAADSVSRLAVGTNETRLVATSGETTGLKYVADTTNYAIAAKGDLLVGTAADTLSALTVGTNGYTLVADSAQTTGLKWAAPASGALTKVTSATFTSATSVSVDNCFTSTYKNYIVIFEIRLVSGGSGDINFRLRAAGSDITTNNYYGARARVSSAATETLAGNNPSTSNTILTSFGAGANNFVNMTIHGPQLADDKSWAYLAFEGASNNGPYYGGGQTFSTTSCDGFTFFWTSASTGKVIVYGLEN